MDCVVLWLISEKRFDLIEFIPLFPWLSILLLTNSAKGTVYVAHNTPSHSQHLATHTNSTNIDIPRKEGGAKTALSPLIQYRSPISKVVNFWIIHVPSFLVVPAAFAYYFSFFVFGFASLSFSLIRLQDSLPELNDSTVWPPSHPRLAAFGRCALHLKALPLRWSAFKNQMEI